MRQSETGSSKLRRVSQGLYRSTASGTYFAHVRIHGKLFRESLRTTDREVASRKLGEFRRKKEKIDPSAGRTTLAEFCDRYLQTIHHLSHSSIKAKTGIVKRIKAEWPDGADKALGSIKPSECERWLGRQAKRISRTHYNAYLQLLKDVFELAVRDRLLADNPAGHLTYLKRDRPIRKTPSFEDFKAIVADIRNQAFNADAADSANFVEFIGLAGLGQAEAASLTWGDIDWDSNTITTFRHKTSQGFQVPLYPQLRPLLERLLERCKCEGMLEGNPPPNAKVLRIKDAKKAIAGACRRLGLSAYTHRAFRRMFITRAIERGIDVKAVAEWQGHRDGGKLILSTYSHLSRSHSNRMAQLMTDAEPANVTQMPKAETV